MASAKDIQRRIRGVKNTGKITRAMEMISAVKMRKAIEAVVAIRPYAENALHVLRRVAVALGAEQHPYMLDQPVRRELYVVVSSNRGLCGAFNAQIVKKLRQVLIEDKDREAIFITLGKKAENSIRRMGLHILASFPELINETDNETRLWPIVNIILEEFTSGRVDRVVVIYTDYVSAMSQIVKVRALLPVTLKDTEKQVAAIQGEIRPEEVLNAEYLFEPSPQSVVESMVPRLLEMELYHAILESNASQEAARMMAMRNATEAAKEMQETLTLTYNQLRQQKITQEIAELSAGMAAVTR